ncbi:hypothetical protein DV515_00007794 [Chloebia gouldiae]|uniref:Uncharacterized protein n=1 Tax=Chloebia gouldiae TaxID=44316 RepID=A0A3L8SGD5_CHLGU|nr:hypothetical protein DV515_00007794 [Chloebia gouldiae]
MTSWPARWKCSSAMTGSRCPTCSLFRKTEEASWEKRASGNVLFPESKTMDDNVEWEGKSSCSPIPPETAVSTLLKRGRDVVGDLTCPTALSEAR